MSKKLKILEILRSSATGISKIRALVESLKNDRVDIYITAMDRRVETSKS